MRKLFAVLAFAVLATACDPVDYTRECQEGGTNEHQCNFQALGAMFIHPSWR